MFKLPRGFRASGVSSGIKSDASQLDISLIVSDQPAVAAGVYTQNLICAAPVVLDRQRTPSTAIQAVITNSGNANACTGEQGMADAMAMTEITAQALQIPPECVLVMSTGVIGLPLDMAKIENGIRDAAGRLADDEDALHAAAQGILTTDTVEKIASRSLAIGDQTVTVTGIAKGSGMIAPNMATMLAVVLTDAALRREDAQDLLADTTARTFNAIDVDGHTSTNDTFLLWASGQASDQPLSGTDLENFSAAVEDVSRELALAIVDDGEGATHRIDIHVRGCKNEEDALLICRAVAGSPLVKTAIAGADPNWGRIVSAAGYAGPAFDAQTVALKVNGCELYRAGVPLPFDDAAVSQSMRENRETTIELDFSEGVAAARFWSCDLTAEYVRINADYRS